MERFKLRSAMMVVHHVDGKGVAVVIPAGSEVISVDPIGPHTGFDHSRLVPVIWAGKMVQIFLLDLVERGERIGGGSH